jgi:hypothetical protein
MRILQPKLSALNASRGGEVLDRLDINKPSADMSPLEYEKFITNYLRISLLIYGKLIHADEYLRLNQIEDERLTKV